ncbi:universal stress protein [Nocardioides sp. zg-DK7169]|uniref:universal stress protein n=1 Tax=Nocardioides sp. zg-DK7169 TaxID=2736600 RepID=UPI00155255A7|nr:universal stress protein [Nocardioides sp. zg-DK7169]NPC96861.1 universal stress protein [Nocardioides sp. zg-DK7169]
MSLIDTCAGAVVVGVDGSEDAEQALAWAATQAALEARPLTIIHAAGLASLTGDEVDPAMVMAAVRAEGRALVQRSAAAVAAREPDLEVRSELVLTDPRVTLLEAAEHAHLVVVGSRGRGPVSSLLLGSVGVALSQHARCPVVVRRPHPPEDSGEGVLVGTDATDRSDPAVAWAFHQASLRRTPLTLVLTFFEAGPEGDVAEGEGGYDALWAQLREVADRFRPRFPDVEVVLRLRRGLADEALTHAAASVEMVVLGHHVRRSIFGLLDLDVPHGVLVHAPRYVAVVRAPPGL